MAGRYEVDQVTLAELLGDEPAYRARQVWEGLYGHWNRPAEMTNISQALRDRLERELPSQLHAAHEQVSEGGDTVKWLWALDDGARIETVLMLYPDRATVCVSTQAGCAMGCGFCATGQAGFERHLGVGEIVEQVADAARRAAPRRVSNVVFMGMGEPLANFDATWGAVERLHDDAGISARRLTISTVGVVPGIERLADQRLPVGLAVSLHAADDCLRDELVPLNRRYPLARLEEACARYRDRTGRRLSFEWALIDATNDRDADADRLAVIARRLGAHVNLIPLNPTPGFATRGSPPERVRAFRDRLRSLHVNVTVRRNRGTDIDAACGQLRAEKTVLLGEPQRTASV